MSHCIVLNNLHCFYNCLYQHIVKWTSVRNHYKYSITITIYHCILQMSQASLALSNDISVQYRNYCCFPVVLKRMINQIWVTFSPGCGLFFAEFWHRTFAGWPICYIAWLKRKGKRSGHINFVDVLAKLVPWPMSSGLGPKPSQNVGDMVKNNAFLWAIVLDQIWCRNLNVCSFVWKSVVPGSNSV